MLTNLPVVLLLEQILVTAGELANDETEKWFSESGHLGASTALGLMFSPELQGWAVNLYRLDAGILHTQAKQSHSG